MSRTGISLLLLPAALLMTAIARAESEPEDAAPAPFMKDEGSWVAGFLNPEGAIVVRPQHDLASVSPFADTGSSASPQEPDGGAEDEAHSDALPATLPATAGLPELAVNVPDLPQIVDRMGTAVLLLSVCLIAAMIYRKRIVLRKQSLKNEPRMRVVSRMPVSRRGEVCLVEIDRRLMVIGLDAQGIRTLVPLDAASPQAPTFAEIQSQAMAEDDDDSARPAPVSPTPSPATPPPRPLVRRRPASLLSR